MSVKGMAYEALYCAFRSLKPGVVMDSGKSKPYVECLEDNLLEGVFRRDFENDLAQVSGNELAGKIRAIHSSAALAVNSFAPFKQNQEEISCALWPAVGDDWSEGEKPLKCFQFECNRYRAWYR